MLSYASRLIAALALTSAATAADALIFAANVTAQPSAMTQSLPPAGLGTSVPPSVDLFAGTALEGDLSASVGTLFDTGSSLSTDLDSADLVLSFDAPVFGAQIFGGITDAQGSYIEGVVRLTIGGDSLEFVAGSAGAAPLGALSTTGFQLATFSLLSFDSGASSVGFLDARSVSAAASIIPLPSGALLLISGISAALILRRRAIGRRTTGLSG